MRQTELRNKKSLQVMKYWDILTRAEMDCPALEMNKIKIGCFLKSYMRIN